MSRLGGIDSQYHYADGSMLSGGMLYFYESGTTTPKTTYTNEDLIFQNRWPIVLDAAGVPPSIFFTGTAKLTLKDKDGNEIRTLDPVSADITDPDITILYRLGDIDSQFFYNDRNDPVRNGKLYIYINGTSTPKTTYSTNELDTPNDWPIVLDENGFLGDVFYEGKARLVLTDEDGVQLRELDEVETFEIDNLLTFIRGCPENVVTVVGGDAVFCVLVNGDEEDYSYQWYKNLTPIEGATDSCVTIVATEGDDGAQIWVTVTDGEGEESCGYATLTVIPECESYVPSTSSTVQGVEIRTATSGAVYNITDAIRTNALLVVDGDNVWQNQPEGTGSQDDPSVLYVSSDFGDNWAAMTIPYDDQGSTPSTQYIANYPAGLSWAGFKKIGSYIYSLVGDWNGRQMGLVKAIKTDTSATAFSIATTQFNGYTTSSPYYGIGSLIGTYNRVLGNADGSVLSGGRPGRNDGAIKIGEWTVADGKAMATLVSEYSLSDSTSVTFIEKVNGYIYQRKQNSGGSTFVSALPYDSMIASGIYKRYTNVTYSSGSWNNFVYAGSWIGTGNRNDTALLTGSVSGGNWEAGVIGHPSSGDKVLMAASAGYYDLAAGGYGKYYFIQDETTDLVDLSSVFVQEDVPNEGYGKFGRMKYIPELGYWIAVYGFSSGASLGPAYFYMRVSVYPDDPTKWSDSAKVLFPDNHQAPTLIGGGVEGMAIGYSDTQNAFVFCAPLQYLGGGSTYRLVTFHIPNVFICED